MTDNPPDDRLQVKLLHDGSDHLARWVDGGGLPFPLEIQAFDDGSPRAALSKLADGLSELGFPCSVDGFLVTDEAMEHLPPNFVGHYKDEDGMARTLCAVHADEFGEDLEELQPFAGAVCEECPNDGPGRLLTNEEISHAVALDPGPPFPVPDGLRKIARTLLRIPDPAAPPAEEAGRPSRAAAPDGEPGETA